MFCFSFCVFGGPGGGFGGPGGGFLVSSKVAAKPVLRRLRRKPPPGPPKIKQNEKQTKAKRKTPFRSTPVFYELEVPDRDRLDAENAQV